MLRSLVLYPQGVRYIGHIKYLRMTYKMTVSVMRTISMSQSSDVQSPDFCLAYSLAVIMYPSYLSRKGGQIIHVFQRMPCLSMWIHIRYPRHVELYIRGIQPVSIFRENTWWLPEKSNGVRKQSSKNVVSRRRKTP